MELTDSAWQTFEGAFGKKYDASVPLQLLEKADDEKEINRILDVLWNELHHQGHVGLASYMALPQLVKIARAKHFFHWSVLGFCSTIEQQRHAENSPELPSEFQQYYEAGIKSLKEFVLENISTMQDDTTYTIALATLATCSGRPGLGKAIEEFCDKDVLDEFLKQF